MMLLYNTYTARHTLCECVYVSVCRLRLRKCSSEWNKKRRLFVFVIFLDWKPLESFSFSSWFHFYTIFRRIKKRKEKNKWSENMIWNVQWQWKSKSFVHYSFFCRAESEIFVIIWCVSLVNRLRLGGHV